MNDARRSGHKSEEKKKNTDKKKGTHSHKRQTKLIKCMYLYNVKGEKRKGEKKEGEGFKKGILVVSSLARERKATREECMFGIRSSNNKKTIRYHLEKKKNEI